MSKLFACLIVVGATVGAMFTFVAHPEPVPAWQEDLGNRGWIDEDGNMRSNEKWIRWANEDGEQLDASQVSEVQEYLRSLK